jgi:hypothetical protein
MRRQPCSIGLIAGQYHSRIGTSWRCSEQQTSTGGAVFRSSFAARRFVLTQQTGSRPRRRVCAGRPPAACALRCMALAVAHPVDLPCAPHWSAPTVFLSDLDLLAPCVRSSLLRLTLIASLAKPPRAYGPPARRRQRGLARPSHPHCPIVVFHPSARGRLAVLPG